ncbi:16105_t:CDS:2, partial [Racocetra persica]
ILHLSNNNFTGSLDCLSEMKKLSYLNISNTDLNEVNMDKLPKEDFMNMGFVKNVKKIIPVKIGVSLVKKKND